MLINSLAERISSGLNGHVISRKINVGYLCRKLAINKRSNSKQYKIEKNFFYPLKEISLLHDGNWCWS